MANEQELPPPRQFGLWSVFVILTYVCVALAITRLLPPRELSIPAIVTAALLWSAIGGMVYFGAGSIEEGGPLMAGAIGTIGGGSAFGVAMIAYEGGGYSAVFLMLFAIPVGAVWAGLFTIFGLVASFLYTLLIKVNHYSIGIVCGTTAGYLSLFPIRNWEEFPNEICLYPALVGGIFGGIGSAAQIVCSGRRKRIRLARLLPVDLGDLAVRSNGVDPTNDPYRIDSQESGVETT
jgi:hypothetical protein